MGIHFQEFGINLGRDFVARAARPYQEHCQVSTVNKLLKLKLNYFQRTTQEEKIGKKANRERDLGIYGALVGSLVILGITRAILFFFVSLKSSKNLHGRMVRSALRAPVRFYDTNSIGIQLLFIQFIPVPPEVSLV